jgi:putative ABC transport system permease protein
MLRNFVKTAIRNLWKQKWYSMLNLSGLTVGIACCVIILLFVVDELSFDNFHRNAHRLYRLNKIVTHESGAVELHAITSGLMGPTLVDEYPELEQSVRLLPWFSEVLMTVDELTLKVPDMLIADANFFEVFDFSLLRGNPNTALAEPLSLVLSKSTAERFFGDENPLGRTVHGFRDQLYTVTGIVEDAPENSHLQYSALISWSSTVPGVGPLDMQWLNNWRTQVNFTYLLLREGAEPAAIESQLRAIMQKHMPERVDQYQLYLQPFREVYLNSADIRYTSSTLTGNRTYVYVLSCIAALILFMACINFINISTAQATTRAREVGMRKILGGGRTQLIAQFLSESMLFGFLALLAALVLVELSLPYVNVFVHKRLQLDFVNIPALLFILIAGTGLLGVAAGIYPAIVLSAFQPLQSIKNIARGGRNTVFARKVLVIVQFTVTTVLIIGTLAVYRQMQFVSQKNLGFDKEQLIILPIGNTDISGQFHTFKTEVLRHPGILQAAGSNSFPGESMMSFSIKPEGVSEDEQWIVPAIRVDDYDFLTTYRMEMAAGRYFSRDHGTDATNGVVINESLAKSLGWHDAIGKRLDIEGELENGRVIGVVKDFHMRSLHHDIEPMLIYYAPRYENLSLRIGSDDIPGTVRLLRNKWQEFESRYPFEYQFLDKKFDILYESEMRLLKILGAFTGLAVFTGCLGLLGLAGFAARQRTKEIGIRKVLGASVPIVIVLLCRDFVKPALLANLIAWPLAWYAMNSWLQDFAYRIEIGWWVFVLAGGVALFIAMVTVSFQAIKAALANPVEALRYE